jgi:hypothetical protein
MIKTGFDVEFLMGAGFILKIVQAAYRSGEFDKELHLPFPIKEPDNCVILDTEQPDDNMPDIRLEATKESGDVRGCIFANLIFLSDAVKLTNLSYKIWPVSEGAPEDINDLSKTFPLSGAPRFQCSLFSKKINHIEFKKHHSTDENPPAYGIYLNFTRNLMGLLENTAAYYLRNYMLPGTPLFDLKDSGDVNSFISRYNFMHDNLPQLSIYPGTTMYADLLEWNPNDLIIKRGNQPENMTGAKIDKDGSGKIGISDRGGSIMLPETVITDDKNNIIARTFGNIIFKGLDFDENDGYVVTVTNERIPSADEVIETFDKNPPRGDSSRGKNYLPMNEDFIIGFCETFIKRYETHYWNSLKCKDCKKLKKKGQNISTEEKAALWNSTCKTCSKRVPYKNKDKEKVGHYRYQEMSWGDNSISVDTGIKYYIDDFPDPNINSSVAIKMEIDESRDLKLVTEVKDVNVDGGVLEDVLFALTGGLSSLALDIVEWILEDAIEEESETKADSFSEQIPKASDLFDRRVPGEELYCEKLGVSHLYDGTAINSKGMTLWGKAGYGTRNVPYSVDIIGKERKKESGGKTTLISLTYESKDEKNKGATQKLLIDDINGRIADKKLKKVSLTPTYIYKPKDSTKIDSIKFQSNVDMKVEEIIFLIRKGIVAMPNFEIYRREDTEYIRGIPDESKSNNLEEMPDFIPEDL